jgi:hypothetical protein
MLKLAGWWIKEHPSTRRDAKVSLRYLIKILHLSENIF